MRILLVSATSGELQPILSLLEKEGDLSSKHKIDSLITGVGMTATAYALGKELSNRSFDLVINIGLAGAFDKTIPLGQVINVIKDRFSEEGSEDGDEFIELSALGLRKENEFPFINNQILNSSNYGSIAGLKEVNAITVNTVHGNEDSIKRIQDRFSPQVESMEGAAFFYACKMEKAECLQIRAISNDVERRDRSNWKIELALNNLADEVVKFLKKLK